MKVNVQDSGKEILITIAGSIDTLTAKDLRTAVESYPFDNADSVVIDLADVPYVSSAGLREFLIMQKRFKKGKLTIRNVSAAVRDIFDVTGFADMFSLEQKNGNADDYTVFSFKDFLASKKESCPDRVILDDGISHWTWQDLDRASELIAEDLIKLGAKKGSHIAICGSNQLNWIAVFFPLTLLFAVTGSYAFVHFCRLLTGLGFISSALIWCGNHTFPMLLLHNLVQLFVCGAFGMEPFRMSTHSEVNDFRTFGVLAIEIAVTAGVIIVIEKISRTIKK